MALRVEKSRYGTIGTAHGSGSATGAADGGDGARAQGKEVRAVEVKSHLARETLRRFVV